MQDGIRWRDDGSHARRCSRCDEWRPPEDFGTRLDGSVIDHCRACALDYLRQWQALPVVGQPRRRTYRGDPLTEYQMTVAMARFRYGTIKEAARRLGVSQASIKRACTEVLRRTGSTSLYEAAYVLWLAPAWGESA